MPEEPELVNTFSLKGVSASWRTRPTPASDCVVHVLMENWKIT